MTKEWFAVFTALFVVAVLLLAWLGWRTRGRRQRDIPAPPRPDSAHRETPIYAAEVLYVATTRSGDAYDRITVHDLGFRARCDIRVDPSGVTLTLPRRDVLIAADAIEAVGTATWTIDRVVEPHGLVRITWQLGEALLDTNLRVQGDSQPLIDAVRGVVPASSRSEGQS